MPALPSNDASMKQPLLDRPASTSQDSPPAYDYPAYTDEDGPKAIPSQDVIVQRVESGPSTYTLQPSAIPAPTVYNYVNPRTGERIVSLLPPNHPEMVCLQAGSHETETRYGILGILAAIFWFPLGVGLCLLDREVRCKRCGAVVEKGVCN